MAYEPGSYLKELEEEHNLGEHSEEPFEFCSSCMRLEEEELARDEGFSSAEEREAWANKQCYEMAPEVKRAIRDVMEADHGRGKHAKYPNRECAICVATHGYRNI